MKKVNHSYKEMREANAVEEVAMLANSPGEASENPDFTNLAQVAFESFITAAKAIFQMKSQLPQVDIKTIYTASTPDQSEPEVLSSVTSGHNKATVLLNSQLWNESVLPDCVTSSSRKTLLPTQQT